MLTTEESDLTSLLLLQALAMRCFVGPAAAGDVSPFSQESLADSEVVPVDDEANAGEPDGEAGGEADGDEQNPAGGQLEDLILFSEDEEEA